MENSGVWECLEGRDRVMKTSIKYVKLQTSIKHSNEYGGGLYTTGVEERGRGWENTFWRC